MFFIYLFYVFLVPLEYLQEKIPKGPTAINYETISMVVFTVWLLIGSRGGKSGRFTPHPILKWIFFYLVSIYVGMMMTYFTFNVDVLSPFDPGTLVAKRFTYIFTGYLLFALAANMVNTRKHIHWLLIAMALSAPIVVRAFRSDLSGVAKWHYNDNMRVAGPFVSIGSNELGAFFLFSAVFMLVNAFSKINWKERLLYAAGGAGYVYGILYCYSRATQLAFGACVALIATLRYRWVLVIIALAAATSNMWLPRSVIDRWQMTENDEGQLDESAANRKVFWQLAVDYFESSPIVGHGVGSFQLMNPKRMDTHNIYYRTLAEQGLVGIIIFAMIWYHLLRLGYELWRKGVCRFDRNYGFALMVASFGMMIANYFGDRFLHLALIGQYWTFAGIAVRLRSHARGEAVLADEPIYNLDEMPDHYASPQGAGEPARPGQPLSAPSPALASATVPRAALWRRALSMGVARKPYSSAPSLVIVGASRSANRQDVAALKTAAREVDSPSGRPAVSKLNLVRPEASQKPVSSR